jgi:RNA polymerase sigma factor (sigma-70 family)
MTSARPLALNALVLPGLKRPVTAPNEKKSRRRPIKSKSRNESYRSDPRLVASCLAGDQAAWNELVERYQWLVYSIPRRYGLGAHDAEDVMQNVFVIVYRRLSTLRDHSLLSAWLIRVTHRETLHQLESGRKETELGAELQAEGTAPAEQLQRLEAQHAVRQALRRLDPKCRQMLELFLSEELPTYEQVARCVGCPVGSVGPTRARCFKKLETILRQMGVEIVP